MMASFIDVTERKRAEEKIIRAKEEWERTFTAVPDLIAIIDNDYRIVRVNKAMAERMGVAPDQAVGMIC
ncbi:MAG: PAS domain-containing protein [Planctomycetota bacterium]|jgi:PAS domain-containing protein